MSCVAQKMSKILTPMHPMCFEPMPRVLVIVQGHIHNQGTHFWIQGLCFFYFKNIKIKWNKFK